MPRTRTWAGIGPALLLVGAIGGAGCEVRAGDGDFSFDVFHGRAQDTWERTYTIAPGGRVEVLNVNGQIRAEVAADGVVRITAERSAKAGSDEAARDLLQKIEMREEVGPERVRVQTVAPRGAMWGGGHKVTYVVRVPAGVHVDLRTVNGGVRLDNVGGEVRAASTNGGVQGRVAGVSLLDARTTNGGVELEVTGPVARDGRVSLTTTNGGVRLAVPEATEADLTARCTNGRVSVTDLDFAADGEQTRRRLSGRLNGGGARIDLQTTNGGVAIRRS
jgi:Putative adhesin